ncbi:MAG: DUF3999 family protein [Bryobacteraceae bacterium]|jgi:hypothetical protein
MTKTVLSLLCLAALMRADFDPAHWQFLRTSTAGAAQQVCVLPLDRTVYERARADLADLRVVRDGREVPYVIETLAGSVDGTELRPEILDRSVVAGAGLELTLDLGRTARHNRLRIATGQTNFRVKVRIETSADGRRWALARADGYVFDFTQGRRSIHVLTVEYPLSTRRFVRTTFFGWMRTDAVTGAWLTDYQERPAVWQSVAVAQPARTEDRETSLVVFDLGAARLPHSRLRLESDAALFHRACEIESSADRKEWRYIGSGVVYRFPDEESLTLDFPEQWDRYLRLRIFNGDDRPVPFPRAVFETIERRVKFLPGGAGQVALYYGNPEAREPSYDLGAILARRAEAAEIVLGAGAERRNGAYRPPAPPEKPWSDRYPAVLYTVLAAAILGMGYVTVEFLRRVHSAG